MPRPTQKLAAIQAHKDRLDRSYPLTESLARALGCLQPQRARQALAPWFGSAERSRIPAFVPLSRTVRKHKEEIRASIKERKANAIQ